MTNTNTNTNKINYAAIFSCAAHHNVPILDWNECEIGAEIGKGAAMTVHTGTAILEGERSTVALKIPNDSISINARARKVKSIIENSRQEMRLMAHLGRKHENIIKFYGLTFDNLQPILVMELAVSALDSYLDKKNKQFNPISLTTKTRFCWEIASGLEWLHSNTVIFGDMKAENVLVCLKSNTVIAGPGHYSIEKNLDPSDDHEEEALIVKLADFGYSQTMLSVFDDEYPGVTPNFMPPEFFEESLRSWRGRPEGDIYSFGLTVHQIANNGMVPFEGEDGPLVDDLNELKQNDTDLLNVLFTSMSGKEECDSLWLVISTSVRYKPAERALLRSLKQTLLNENMADVYGPMKGVAAKWVDYKEESVQKTASEPNHEYKLPNFTYLKSLPISNPLKKWLFNDYLRIAKNNDSNLQTLQAMFIIFESYQYGFGVEPNEEELGIWGSSFTNTIFNFLKPKAVFTLDVCAQQDLWNDIEWFKTMIPGDISLWSVKMGMCYEYGWVLEKDVKLALNYYQQAASKGQDRAYICLGNFYANGTDGKKDLVEAITWYSKAAEVPQAQFKLGYIFSTSSGFKFADRAESFSWYLKAAKAGLPAAQYVLGNIYRVEPEKNPEKAFHWHQKAAEAGLSESCYLLGTFYHEGEGVKQNAYTSVEWFTKGTAAGNDNAKFKLALAFYNGEGVIWLPWNATLAVNTFRELANTMPEASFYLATALWNGKGCVKNVDEAMDWFRKASDSGDYKSKMHIAKAYRYGLGVERNWLESADWYFTMRISRTFRDPPWQFEAPLVAALIIMVVEYTSLLTLLWCLYGGMKFFISLSIVISFAMPKKTPFSPDEDIRIVLNRRRTLGLLLPRALYLYLIPVPEMILSYYVLSGLSIALISLFIYIFCF